VKSLTEKTFENAIQLHQQSKDVLGQANDLRNLGEVYMRKDQLDEAEKAFENAIQLHQQSKSVLGEANDLQHLFLLYIQKNQPIDAKRAFIRLTEICPSRAIQLLEFMEQLPQASQSGQSL
jgi:tetratricopeptide (TPR) repeat protein